VPHVHVDVTVNVNVHQLGEEGAATRVGCVCVGGWVTCGGVGLVWFMSSSNSNRRCKECRIGGTRAVRVAPRTHGNKHSVVMSTHRPYPPLVSKQNRHSARTNTHNRK